MSCCDLDLTFDLAVVTFSLKILSGYISETIRCMKLKRGRSLVRRCRCAMSWCDLVLTFDLAVVTLTYKVFLGYILETV